MRAGLDAVEITLPAAEDLQETVTVTAPALQAPEAVKNSAFWSSRARFSRARRPCRMSALRAVGLPGVVIGSNDFRNDIIVRGGSPLENPLPRRQRRDPNINAFANFASAGGTVSLLDAELLQDVTFLTGGYPAPYHQPHVERALQVTQSRGQPQKAGGGPRSALPARAPFSKGPSAPARGSWVVSARRSFLDLFATRGRRVRRRAGGVFAQRQGRLRPHAAGPHLGGGQPRGRRPDPTRPTLISTDLEEEIANFDIRDDGWRSAGGFTGVAVWVTGRLYRAHSHRILQQSHPGIAGTYFRLAE